MRVSKWVDMGKEVEIEIGMEDIRCALSEAFANVDNGAIMGDEKATARDVTLAFSRIGTFLNALTNEHIAALTLGQRKVIGDFLSKQAARFGPLPEPPKGDE